MWSYLQRSGNVLMDKELEEYDEDKIKCEELEK